MSWRQAIRHFAIIVFLLLSVAEPAAAREPSGTNVQRIEPLGHNVAATTAVLGRRDVTIGLYAAGVGITDHLTLASNVWLDTSYNMPNLIIKYGLPRETLGGRFSVSTEGAYFKTAPYGERWYQQESMLARLTVGWQPAERWYIYLGTVYQKFLDDERPFSLRPPTSDGDSASVAMSLLQRFDFSEGMGVFFETGVLGLDDPVRYRHLGASVYVAQGRWLAQLGASRSRAERAVAYDVDDRGRYLGPAHHGDKPHRSERHGRVVLIHPEVQLQHFF